VLSFPLDVWQRLRLFIRRCPTEISGYGIVRQSSTNPGLFMVEDIMILDQVADGHSATPDPTAVDELLYRSALEGKDGALRLLWHSHVKMPAYFSAVDLTTISEYSGEWMISLVSNHMGEVTARLDVMKPVWAGTMMQVKVMIPPNSRVADEVDELIRRHVRRPGVFRRNVQPDKRSDYQLLDASEVETNE
jgi:hypothetical protein